MICYRIASTKYARDLCGTGAALFGGRWNPEGMPMVYTAMARSLAILEYLAHNMHLMATAKISLVTIEIQEDAQIEKSIISKQLQLDEILSDIQRSRRIGKAFLLNQQSYAMQVPSVIVPNEYNLLLNPNHPAHANTKVMDIIEDFKLDRRLYSKKATDPFSSPGK